MYLEQIILIYPGLHIHFDKLLQCNLVKQKGEQFFFSFLLHKHRFSESLLLCSSCFESAYISFTLRLTHTQTHGGDCKTGVPRTDLTLFAELAEQFAMPL